MVKKVTFKNPPLTNPNWKDFDESRFKYEDFSKILDTKK